MFVYLFFTSGNHAKFNKDYIEDAPDSSKLNKYNNGKPRQRLRNSKWIIEDLIKRLVYFLLFLIEICMADRDKSRTKMDANYAELESEVHNGDSILSDEEKWEGMVGLALHRRPDTFYLVALGKERLLLPPKIHNYTLPPKMALVLPPPYNG